MIIVLVYSCVSFHNYVMELDLTTIQKIISIQYPKYASFEIRNVVKSGHDNQTFHLGNEYSLRFPSAYDYSSQVLKEHQFCKKLQESISYRITEPIELGQPSDLFPYHFSINSWIDGESMNEFNVKDKNQLAYDLAQFLNELKQCDPHLGPLPGPHNFYRGGNLSTYHEETIQAIKECDDFDQTECLKIWHTGLNSDFKGPNTWIHGDLEKDNLLIKDDRLYAVIDFGNMGIGDPACDYVMAWTYFNIESRQIFLQAFGINQAMINRAKAWALWKAIISLNNPNSRLTAINTLNELLSDSKTNF